MHYLPFPVLTAQDAAAMIKHGQTVGFSAFTPAGSAKAIPRAIAERAKTEHTAGRSYQIRVLTGASTGESLDGALASANAISFRAPWQSDKTLRALINSRQVPYLDMHLSTVQQSIRYGFLGPVHWAVIEACDVTAGGGIVLTASVGASNTFANRAEKVLIELNGHHPPTMLGLHDIFEPQDPPNRREIHVHTVSDRIGSPILVVPPEKIAGIVETNQADEFCSMASGDSKTAAIGRHVAEFLTADMRAGRIPKRFLPLQSGIGAIANAVFKALGEMPEIPPFEMYSEVLQDAVIDLIQAERCTFASGTALTVTPKIWIRSPAIWLSSGGVYFASAGDLEQPGDHPPPGNHLHQHRTRGRPLWQRQLDTPHGDAFDEWNRRLGRLHEKRLHFDFHVPVGAEEREDFNHRTAGNALGSFRAFRPGRCYRMGRGRPPRQG